MVRIIIQAAQSALLGFQSMREVGRFEITKNEGGFNWTYLEKDKSPQIGWLPSRGKDDQVDVLCRCLSVVGGRARRERSAAERTTSTGVTLRSVR